MEIRFRASQSGALMTDPRTKADKLAGKMSKTAESMIKDLWRFNEYGIDEPVVTPQMMKGLLCEQDAMKIAQELISAKTFRVKNTTNFKNDHFTGTPDIVLNDDGFVEDLKCSWTLKTFMEAEVSNMYLAQAHVYMELTGLKQFRLLYCLVNTPHELIVDEEKRFFYKFGCNEENEAYQEACYQLRKMHNFDHIPVEKRIKSFVLNYNPAFMADLTDRAIKAKEYYKTISL